MNYEELNAKNFATPRVKQNSKIGISRIKPPPKCKCVDCEEDELYGGLWNANKYPGKDDLHTKKIHIVVSHCKNDLDWISDFTKGYNIASIHVITKCGAPVNGAPNIATIQVLPNVGRCDHTYAYYMSTVLDQKVEIDDEKGFNHRVPKGQYESSKLAPAR
jgi:hypothetical protein